jgi:hypothetical protein
MTYVFALYFEEKITSSQSSTPTSSIGISKYYSLSIDGRDNVINDLVFSSSSISFKFKNGSNSNSNKNNGNKYEINTTDRYMIYDIIGELRNDGWLLLSVSSSNNGNKEKYLFEYNDNNNDDDDNDNDAINDTNDIKKSTNNKSVFHSIKTIFSTTKNSNSKHTNSSSNSNSNSSNSKHTNSNNSSNSNSNVKKHKNDNKDKGKQTSLSISLDDDINVLRDQYNTSSIEHNIDIQTDYYEDKSVDDISNAPLSSNSTSSHSPNHQKRTTTFEPDKSPISPRKKIQQQLYALGNKGNPSPKTISSAAHPNRVVNSTKKPATGSLSPQRTKPSNQTNQDITPTRTSKNIANTVATPAGARAILRKSEKEPPLVLSELPKKKYDLSVNLGSVEGLQENFILKDKNGRDEHSRLDILWS